MSNCSKSSPQKRVEQSAISRKRDEIGRFYPISNDFFYKEFKKAIIVYSELSNKHAANGYNGYKKLC